MIGDNPRADLGGGASAGLRTAWLPRGRTWPADLPYRPDSTFPSCSSAIAGITR